MIAKRYAAALFTVATLAGAAAHANPDLRINYNNVQVRASSPTKDTGVVTVPMTFNTGYSQQAPFQVPCDSDWLSAGVAYTYGNTGPGVYPELTGRFYLNGDEHKPIISHGYNNTVPGGFDHVNAPDNNILMKPGDTLSEGFIAWNQVIPFWQWGFQSSDLPANTPVVFHLMVGSYSCTTWDYTDNGYSPACFIPDAVPWNNAVNLWMVRHCE